MSNCEPKPAEGIIHVTLFSGPDEFGNYSHSRQWWDDYFPGHPDGEHGWRLRGQMFNSPLPEGDYETTDER